MNKGCSALLTTRWIVTQSALPNEVRSSTTVFVLHGSLMCLQRCALLPELLAPVERVALCIAALGHDIGHMGVQNAFLVNSKDPLALQYNDRSVLENFHCSRLFSVLNQRGCGLLDGLSVEQYGEALEEAARDGRAGREEEEDEERGGEA